jgi:hypothetical protein
MYTRPEMKLAILVLNCSELPSKLKHEAALNFNITRNLYERNCVQAVQIYMVLGETHLGLSVQYTNEIHYRIFFLNEPSVRLAEGLD